MIQKDITFFGQPCALACDAKCNKAWGINNRPRVQLSDNIDDYEHLADNELPEAPENPGTYEGGEGKPNAYNRLNKWCARECERSVIVDRGQPIVLPDYSKRVRNITVQDDNAG